MKKNILTIIILALCTINVILTAVVIFAALPTMNKANKLVTQVASVIDLELESPDGKDKTQQVDVKDIETYKVEYSSGTVTINLKKGSDGKEHWGQLDSVTLSVNKKSKDYGALSKTLESYNSKIMEIVTDIISSYNYSDVNENREEIKKEALKQIQQYFNSDFIIDISLDNLRFQ